MSAQGATPPPKAPALSPLAASLRKADARWLLLLPLAVVSVLGVLLLPWSAEPEGMPLPSPDARVLRKVVATDAASAQRARAEPLPGPVRALGTALRAYHVLESQQAGEAELAAARSHVDAQLPDAFRAGDDALVALRAVQLEGFLDEVARFEATGVESAELTAIAGTFVPSMSSQGWCRGHSLAAGPGVLRVMFKEMWNAFLGLRGRPAFEPTLDESRLLFAFYLAHPHPSPNARAQADAMRRGARDPKECAAAETFERRATERWRLERIARIAAIDPEYPAAYARGVASYGAGSYGVSVGAFRSWLQDHPGGPYTLRAQTFLRAALAAAQLD